MKQMKPLSPADRARALARYRLLRGQGGVVLRFGAVGPVVEAATPNELEAATAALTAIGTES